ncbi:MAG: hypothetical protein RBG1_1C00001G1745 [candidate division Zixibacteria bacterium RBG-1]|nr:MAG: hypothetical protein RBG1_1C00001G1745 [candidate division Zixibacteria bacterium RBG-1]OGC85348.1 MAG: hypothetical protein A2V73_09025 [candidate division Zixibacteria bacterium RBG_19FT_COMBO_42_43]
MVTINYASREISCKIVFYGPGLSGKTTNLQYVHKKVPTQTRGELISLATDTDRTLFFDFLPINLGTIQGFSTRFQLYTVPGQVYYNATRKLVLRGVDGLVFVGDSQLSKMDENVESLNNLMENLKEYGYKLEELPLVIQYNKRDLENVASLEELEKIINTYGCPYFEAVAVKGVGVFDTLKMICKLVMAKIQKQAGVAPEPTVERQVAVPAVESGLSSGLSPLSQERKKLEPTEVVKYPDVDRKSFEQENEGKREKEPVFSSSKEFGEKTEVLREDKPEGFQTTAQSSQIPEIKPLQTSDAKVTKSKHTESKAFETNVSETTLRGAKSLEMDTKKKAEEVKKIWPEFSGLKVIRDTPRAQAKKRKKRFFLFRWFKKSKKS